MTNILARIARTAAPGRFHQFRPATIAELFAFSLARKLGDKEAAAHYAELAASYSEETLLWAYRRTRKTPFSADFGRRFHAELEAAGLHSVHLPAARLLAIKVERRIVAATVFIGHRLDHSQVRHLPPQSDRAEASAIGFLNWLLDNFGIQSAALEALSAKGVIRRATINRALLDCLRERSVPIWEVSKQQLLESFGYPALRSRTELRQVTTPLVWPALDGGSGLNQRLDAAALGLHVQTERLFTTDF
ncbi:MAG: hypothetical protein ABSG25_05390 [Bryobacteraceae bacterium]